MGPLFSRIEFFATELHPILFEKIRYYHNRLARMSTPIFFAPYTPNPLAFYFPVSRI